MTVNWAPVPWRVDAAYEDKMWRDSVSIADAEGGHVCHLTRGYEGGEDGSGGPSWENAHLIAAAPALHASGIEINRLSLIIENAVRSADPENHEAVLEALKANRAALAAARMCGPPDAAPTVSP